MILHHSEKKWANEISGEIPLWFSALDLFSLFGIYIAYSFFDLCLKRPLTTDINSGMKSPTWTHAREKFKSAIYWVTVLQSFKNTFLWRLPYSSNGKESACDAGGQGLILGWEDALEKRMAIHSNILAWRIPWTEQPGGLQFMGSQRVGHDWATNTYTSFYEI